MQHLSNEPICKIRKARFLHIGSDCVMAGSTVGHPTLRDGSTIYTGNILTDDGEIVQTEDGFYSYVRTH